MDPQHVPSRCHPWLSPSWPTPGSQPLLPCSAGPAPSQEAGTKARFRLSDAVEEGAWTASVVEQQDSTLSLQLSTPADAPIGLYRLSLEASTGYQGSSFVLGHFTLLFNAWCPGESHPPPMGGWEMGRTRPTPEGEEMRQKRHRSGLSEAHSEQLPRKPCEVRTPAVPIYKHDDLLKATQLQAILPHVPMAL